MSTNIVLRIDSWGSVMRCIEAVRIAVEEEANSHNRPTNVHELALREALYLLQRVKEKIGTSTPLPPSVPLPPDNDETLSRHVITSLQQRNKELRSELATAKSKCDALDIRLNELISTPLPPSSEEGLRSALKTLAQANDGLRTQLEMKIRERDALEKRVQGLSAAGFKLADVNAKLMRQLTALTYG